MILSSNHLNLKKNRIIEFLKISFNLGLIFSIFLIINAKTTNEHNNNNELNKTNTTEMDSQVNDQVTLETLTIFYFTLAEIAWSREQINDALALYLNTLNVSTDPTINELITNRFLQTQLTSETLYAVEKWLALSPNNNKAQLIYLMLLIQSKQTEKAETTLQNIIQKWNKIKFSEDMELLLSQLSHQQKTILLNISIQIHNKNPNNEKNNYLLAQLYFSHQRYNIAMQLIKPIVKKNPSWFQSTQLYIELLINSQQIKKASYFLSKRYFKSHAMKFLYARVLIEQKKYTKAKKLLFQLEKIKKYKVEAQLELALIAQQQKNYKKANTLLLKIINTKEVINKNPIYYYLGKNEQLQNNPFKSIEHYNKIQSGQYLLLAQINKIMLLTQHDRFEQAFKSLKILYVQFPEQIEAITLLITNILIKKEKIHSANKLITFALKQQPDNINLLYTKAVILLKTKQDHQAEMLLKHILTLQPNHFKTLNTLGYLLTAQSVRYKEAYRYIQQALAQQPNNPIALDNMGWILFLLGKNKNSLYYLEKAYKLDNNDEIAAHLGMVLWESGQKKRARKIWRKSIKKNPNAHLLKSIIKEYDPQLLTY